MQFVASICDVLLEIMMKSLFFVAFALAAASASAQTPMHEYPSCDLAAQHALMGETGGSIKDAGQAHISMRANILEADLGSARKARRLTQAQADRLFKRVEKVRKSTDALAGTRGFLSVAELARYDRKLDAVAMRICRS